MTPSKITGESRTFIPKQTLKSMTITPVLMQGQTIQYNQNQGFFQARPTYHPGSQQMFGSGTNMIGNES